MRVRTNLSAFSTSSTIYGSQMTDVVVPQFKKRRDAGELISNPMTRILYEGSPHQTGSWVHHSVIDGTERSGFTYTFESSRTLVSPTMWNETDFASIINSIPGKENLPSLIDELQTRVSAKVGSGDTQSLVSLAEARKTGAMLTKAGKFLLRPVSDARRILKVTRKMMGDANTRRAVFAKASSLWLEARYGWRPFIFDVMAHCEALKEPRPVRQTFRARQPVPAAEHHYQVPLVSAGGLGDIVSEQTGTITATLRCGQTVDYRAAINLQVLQFGGYDILGTAWELIPYSFVVDWFIGVGDALQALQAYALVDRRVGFSVIRYELDLTTEVKALDPKFFQIHEYHWVAWTCPTNAVITTERILWMERIVPSSFLPSLRFSIDLDWPQVVDLALLFKQLRK